MRSAVCTKAFNCTTVHWLRVVAQLNLDFIFRKIVELDLTSKCAIKKITSLKMNLKDCWKRGGVCGWISLPKRGNICWKEFVSAKKRVPWSCLTVVGIIDKRFPWNSCFVWMIKVLANHWEGKRRFIKTQMCIEKFVMWYEQPGIREGHSDVWHFHLSALHQS